MGPSQAYDEVARSHELESQSDECHQAGQEKEVDNRRR